MRVLAQIRPSERVHLLIEAGACGQRESIIYPSVGKHRHSPCRASVSNSCYVCCRNLLCVYSKKHIFDVPEEAESKQKANARTLREMTLLLR